MATIELLEIYTARSLRTQSGDLVAASVYGSWRVRPKGHEAREIAACVGLRECVEGTARAAGSWRGLCEAWHEDAADWDQARPPFASSVEAEPYLEALYAAAERLLEEHEDAILDHLQDDDEDE